MVNLTDISCINATIATYDSRTTSNYVYAHSAVNTDPTYVRFEYDTENPNDYVIEFTASVTLNYIIIGGGGAGQTSDINSDYGNSGFGGNAGQIQSGSITLSNGDQISISIGNGGISTPMYNHSGGNTSITKNPDTPVNTATGGTANFPSDIPVSGTGNSPGLTPIDGINLTAIPSDHTFYGGGGGVGGVTGGNGGASGGNGGDTNHPDGYDGYTPGSGGGGGWAFRSNNYQTPDTNGAGGSGAPGLVILYIPLGDGGGGGGGDGGGGGGGSVCFLAGTPVVTDQGEVAIDKIDIKVNTINGKRIVAITETPGTMDCLCLIQKDLLGENMPNQDTLISVWHKVLYNGEMTEAQDIPGVLPHEYNDQPLYNVLMDDHETMKINGLTVETLLPTHQVARRFLQLCQKS